MRSSKLLPSLLAVAILLQPVPSWAQAGDAFATGDIAVLHPSEYLQLVATDLNRRWVQQKRPDYPDVLVRFDKGQQEICVAKAASPERSLSPVQIQKVSQLVKDAISSQSIADWDRFCILFKFKKSAPRSASPDAKSGTPIVAGLKPITTPTQTTVPTTPERNSPSEQSDPSSERRQAPFLPNKNLRPLNSGTLYITLGDMERTRGQLSVAISMYKTALVVGGFSDVEIGKTYTKLGQAYQAKQDFPQAMAAYGEALKHNPNIPEILGAVTVGCEEAWVRRPDGSQVRTVMSATLQKKQSTSDHGDVDFGPYMADLQRRIKKQWHPPKGSDNSYKVVVVFKIHTNGEVSDLHIDSSKGSSTQNESAINAVKAASPVRHLPNNAPENVDIQFTFDYNVFSQWPIYTIVASQPGKFLDATPHSSLQQFDAPWVRSLPLSTHKFRQF